MVVRKLNRTGSFLFCALLSCACPAFADEGPAPGPALDARQKLFGRIQQAKARGIGIGGYLQAFNALEDQVKAGDSEDKINSRVEAINKAVNDQLERAKILKTQKPLPPQGSQIAGSGSAAPPAAAKTAAAPPPAAGAKEGKDAGGGDIVSKLKEKFGDRIPDNLKEKLMSDPRIMEKIKERTGN